MKGSELFPISDYYKNCIEDAITLRRTKSSWTAILLIRDPKKEKKNSGFINGHTKMINGTGLKFLL